MMPSDPYSLAARVYDLLVEPFMAPVRRLTAHLLQSNLEEKTHPRILELACGTGGQSREIQKRGLSVVGLDLSPAMLKQAWKKNGFPKTTGHFLAVQADAANMPFEGGQFDAVVVQLALHEMDPTIRHQIMAEMLRTTAPKAVFIMVDFLVLPKPNLSSLVLTLIERAAGKRHYSNGRHFLAQGGVNGFIKQHPQLRVESRQPFFQQNVALVMARKA